MSRRSKGAHLYLRGVRTDSRSGRPIPSMWYIRDGAIERGTGCGPDSRAGAEQALAAYIALKWAPPTAPADGGSDPAQVLIADVLALYARERAPLGADPVSTGGRIRALLGWWGGRPVADVRRSTCQAYVAHRTTQPLKAAKSAEARLRMVSAQGARRELEDLSAAIGYWCAETPLHPRPTVWLPERRESPRRALTRDQAAALLRAARGYRRDEDGVWTSLGGATRANRRHLRRFILLGLYTGSRPGVIPQLLWAESPTAPWVDLDAGVIYRRGRDQAESKTKRRPVVKLPARLVGHLKRWRATDLRWHERLRAEGIDPPAAVIHHGAHGLAGRIRRGFASCVADAGLDPEITPHWLRHTCATWLMEAGCDLWAAAGYTGMTVAVLESHYAHHRPDHQARARAALGGRR